MGIPEIAAALAAIKTATDIARTVKTAETSLSHAELKLRLADMISALADVKIELSALAETIVNKDLKIKELERLLEEKKDIEKFGDAYYRLSETGEAKGEPLCTKCWEVDKMQVHLVANQNNRSFMTCPNCDSHIRMSHINGPLPNIKGGTSGARRVVR